MQVHEKPVTFLMEVEEESMARRVNGKGEESGGEERGEAGWYVKQMGKKCYLH